MTTYTVCYVIGDILRPVRSFPDLDTANVAAWYLAKHEARKGSAAGYPVTIKPGRTI